MPDIILHEQIKDHDRILIVKLSAIGDVIHTLPVAHALKAQFNHLEVAWLVEKRVVNILDKHPCVDHLYVFDRTVRSFWQLAHLFRQEAFDWVIDFQGTYKSQAFVWASRATYKVGFSQRKEYFPYGYSHVMPPAKEIQHAVDKNMALLSFCTGKPVSKVSFGIPVFPPDKQHVKQVLEQQGVGDTYVVMSATCTRLTNRWPKERFSELIRHITETHHVPVILIGTMRDYSYNEKIVVNIPNAFNVSGQFSLRETVQLLRDAKLFVSGDTGPLHMAVSAKCPVVAIFGSTDPVRTGPYGGRFYIINKKVACAPCFKKTCKRSDLLCLEKVFVEEVVAACRRFL